MHGAVLHEIGMSPDTDNSDIIGCFEQAELQRSARTTLSRLQTCVNSTCSKVVSALPSLEPSCWSGWLAACATISSELFNVATTMFSNSSSLALTSQQLLAAGIIGRCQALIDQVQQQFSTINAEPFAILIMKCSISRLYSASKCFLKLNRVSAQKMGWILLFLRPPQNASVGLALSFTRAARLVDLNGATAFSLRLCRFVACLVFAVFLPWHSALCAEITHNCSAGPLGVIRQRQLLQSIGESSDFLPLCHFIAEQVLDRLNALFEPGGELVISERGLDSSGWCRRGYLLVLVAYSRALQQFFVIFYLLKQTPSGQVSTIRPHPNFRAFMAMNSVSGEVSQPMRNRGIEISILSSDFSREDAVQVALASGVSLRDAVALLPSDCSIRHAKFVAEAACALGGYGCSMEESRDLIDELHQKPGSNDLDCCSVSQSVQSCTTDILQQPSLHAWLNEPDQAKFLRSCCSVAAIALTMKDSNMQSDSPSSQSPPSVLAAACAFLLYVSARDSSIIKSFLDYLAPNSFLDYVGAAVMHLDHEKFDAVHVEGSFDVLFGYFSTISTNTDYAVEGECDSLTLRMWFSVILSTDSLYLRNQGKLFVLDYPMQVHPPLEQESAGWKEEFECNRSCAQTQSSVYLLPKLKSTCIECILYY
jgi:hypothetical protein